MENRKISKSRKISEKLDKYLENWIISQKMIKELMEIFWNKRRTLSFIRFVEEKHAGKKLKQNEIQREILGILHVYRETKNSKSRIEKILLWEELK